MIRLITSTTLSDANPDDDSVVTISANLLRNAGLAVAQKTGRILRTH